MCVCVCVFALDVNVAVKGAKVHMKGERGQRWTHTDASLTHPWKRGRDPHCTQTAFRSGGDTERVRAYLPQSSGNKTANMTRLALHRINTEAPNHLI